MALATYYAALGTQYTLRFDVNLSSQNTVANTSKVAWTLTAIKNTGTGYWNFDPTTWNVSINGVGYSGSVTYDFRNYRELVLASGVTDVAHTADGTKSIVVAANYNPDNGPAFEYGGISAQTYGLTPISVGTVPKVSPSPATVGSVVTISLPRTNSSFTHNITWTSGSLSGTIGTGIATSTTWTVPNVMGQYPDKTNAPINITVQTKNGAANVGTPKSVTLFARDAVSASTRDALFPFDLRARLVVWDAGHWKATTVLPTLTISMVDPASATATCEIELSRALTDVPDYSVIDIEANNGVRWINIGHRFVLSRVEEDGTDLTRTVKYSGTEFVDFELSHGYVPVQYLFPGQTPGNIMDFAIDRGLARGWAPRLAWDFSWTKTSDDVAWANPAVARDLSPGTPFSQVLEGLVSDGYVEYTCRYDSDKAWLQMHNPGTGSDWSVAGADPVINLSAARLTSAPRRGTNEDVLTRVTVAGDGELRRTREKASSDPNVFGQLEGWVAASGITKEADADKIGDNALADASTPTDERTFEFSANANEAHFWPYFAVRPGDWVLIPSTTGENSQRARVGQITMSRDTEGEVTVTILTGDRILSGSGELAKRQQAQTGGAIPGGGLKDPATLDASIPNDPTITATTSTGYWNSDGAAKAAITLTWSKVNTSVTGSTLPVSYYEIWWRPDIATPWAMFTISDELSTQMIGWDILKPVQFRVRARSTAGIFGEWSLFVEHTTAKPTTPIAAPDTPNVTADALGRISIEWNGKIAGATAPKHLAYVRAEVGTTNTGPWSPAGAPLTSAGTATVDPQAYGDWYLRLRPVDRLGQEGTASAVVHIFTEDPGLILKVPVAPTGLASTTDTEFAIDGSSLDAWFDLTWNAVDEDTEGNPIIVQAYEVWGRTGTADDTLLATVSDTSAHIMVMPTSVWTFSVRAISDVGSPSAFSSEITDTADGTPTGMTKTTAPTVTSTRALLRIDWDGNLIGDIAPPNQFRHTYAEYALTSDHSTWFRVGTPFLRGGGSVYVPLTVDVSYDVRLTPVALDGSEGPKSDLGTAVVMGIAAVDMTPLIENMLSEPRIETSPNANEGVKLYNGGIIAYDAVGNPTIIVSATDGAIYFAHSVIDGDSIITGSITSDQIDVGNLVTSLISSTLGRDLVLTSNETIQLIAGNLDGLMTYFQVTPDGAVISSPNTNTRVQITDAQINMQVNGVTMSYWNALGLTAPALIANETATIGAHQFRKEDAHTTIRAL